MLTLQMHIAPDYVLDRMPMYEARALMDNAHFAIKDGWEQARMVSYITAQCQSSKRLDPDDIMRLPWEGKAAESEPVTEEQIQALKAKAEDYARTHFRQAEKR